MHSSWFLSSWILVIYSFERMLAISFPFMLNRFIKVSTAKKICILSTILSLIAFSPIFLTDTYTIVYQENDGPFRACRINAEVSGSVQSIWYLTMTLALTVLLPPILILVFNSILLKKLIEISRQRNILTNRRSEGSNPEIKNAKDLLSLSSLMLVFTFPTLAWLIYLYLYTAMRMFLFLVMK